MVCVIDDDIVDSENARSQITLFRTWKGESKLGSLLSFSFILLCPNPALLPAYKFTIINKAMVPISNGKRLPIAF